MLAAWSTLPKFLKQEALPAVFLFLDTYEGTRFLSDTHPADETKTLFDVFALRSTLKEVVVKPRAAPAPAPAPEARPASWANHAGMRTITPMLNKVTGQSAYAGGASSPDVNSPPSKVQVSIVLTQANSQDIPLRLFGLEGTQGDAVMNMGIRSPLPSTVYELPKAAYTDSTTSIKAGMETMLRGINVLQLLLDTAADVGITGTTGSFDALISADNFVNLNGARVLCIGLMHNPGSSKPWTATTPFSVTCTSNRKMQTLLATFENVKEIRFVVVVPETTESLNWTAASVGYGNEFSKRLAARSDEVLFSGSGGQSHCAGAAGSSGQMGTPAPVFRSWSSKNIHPFPTRHETRSWTMYSLSEYVAQQDPLCKNGHNCRDSMAYIASKVTEQENRWERKRPHARNNNNRASWMDRLSVTDWMIAIINDLNRPLAPAPTVHNNTSYNSVSVTGGHSAFIGSGASANVRMPVGGGDDAGGDEDEDMSEPEEGASKTHGLKMQDKEEGVDGPHVRPSRIGGTQVKPAGKRQTAAEKIALLQTDVQTLGQRLGQESTANRHVRKGIQEEIKRKQGAITAIQANKHKSEQIYANTSSGSASATVHGSSSAATSASAAQLNVDSRAGKDTAVKDNGKRGREEGQAGGRPKKRRGAERGASVRDEEEEDDEEGDGEAEDDSRAALRATRTSERQKHANARHETSIKISTAKQLIPRATLKALLDACQAHRVQTVTDKLPDGAPRGVCNDDELGGMLFGKVDKDGVVEVVAVVIPRQDRTSQSWTLTGAVNVVLALVVLEKAVGDKVVHVGSMHAHPDHVQCPWPSALDTHQLHDDVANTHCNSVMVILDFSGKNGGTRSAARVPCQPLVVRLTEEAALDIAACKKKTTKSGSSYRDHQCNTRLVSCTPMEGTDKPVWSLDCVNGTVPEQATFVKGLTEKEWDKIAGNELLRTAAVPRSEDIEVE